MARAYARAKVRKRTLQETGFKKSLKRLEFEQEIFKRCMQEKNRRNKSRAQRDLPIFAFLLLLLGELQNLLVCASYKGKNNEYCKM